jgi:hypothetical protein
MQTSKFRALICWIIGLTVFTGLLFAAVEVSSDMGIELQYLYSGLEYGDYDEEDRFTPFGWFLIFIFGVVASWVGMALYHGRLENIFMKDTRLQLMAFGLGLGIYGFVDLVVWEFYSREIKRYIPAIVYNIFNLAFLAVVVLASMRFYKFIKSR